MIWAGLGWVEEEIKVSRNGTACGERGSPQEGLRQGLMKLENSCESWNWSDGRASRQGGRMAVPVEKVEIWQKLPVS